MGPDAIHAPWRLAYLESLGASETTPDPELADAAAKGSGSFLRDYWLTPQHDERNHVIVRTQAGMILLNRYPYANGHLLVALGEPRPTLLEYPPKERAALWMLVELAADLIDRALQPQGVNIGMNQGRAAGAGVPGHLHVHIVPRWSGDVNFISTVGQIRVIPSALEMMAKRYRDAWSAISSR